MRVTIPTTLFRLPSTTHTLDKKGEQEDQDYLRAAYLWARREDKSSRSSRRVIEALQVTCSPQPASFCCSALNAGQMYKTGEMKHLRGLIKELLYWKIEVGTAQLGHTLQPTG